MPRARCVSFLRGARPRPPGSPLFVCAGEGAGSAAGRPDARGGVGRAPSGSGGSGARRLRGSGGRLLHGSGNLFVIRLSGGRRRGAGLGGRRPAGRTEITLKLERVWNRKCWGGGGRVCGPAAGSSGDCPPAALFVRRRAAPFRALQSVRGGLSALRSDKAEWAAGRPRRRSFLRRCEGLLRLGRLRRRGWASSGGSVPGAAA